MNLSLEQEIKDFQLGCTRSSSIILDNLGLVVKLSWSRRLMYKLYYITRLEIFNKIEKRLYLKDLEKHFNFKEEQHEDNNN